MPVGKRIATTGKPDHRLVVRVHALPRGSHSRIQGVRGGRLLIKTTAAPADGKANKDLIRQLAQEFRVPPSRVELTSGAAHRDKTFRISEPAVLPSWLAELDVKP